MPGIVKIGKTTRSVEQRCFELYQTGVPTPFKVENYFLSPDCHALEQVVHLALDSVRVSDGREFFSISPADALYRVSELHRGQVTEWVQDFLPEHIIVESELVVGENQIFSLSTALEAHPFCVVSALETITPEEAAPLMQRWNEARKQSAAEHEQPDGSVMH